MNEEDVAYPVAQQLDADDARDIDRFMACWAEDCRSYAFPDTLLADGAAAIRDRHLDRFREPDLHGTLLSRVVVGDLVVDHETVRRNVADGPGEVEVICIDRVSKGRIAAAWFQRLNTSLIAVDPMLPATLPLGCRSRQYRPAVESGSMCRQQRLVPGHGSVQASVSP